jgi:hypothetical protein
MLAVLSFLKALFTFLFYIKGTSFLVSLVIRSAILEKSLIKT